MSEQHAALPAVDVRPVASENSINRRDGDKRIRT